LRRNTHIVITGLDTVISSELQKMTGSSPGHNEQGRWLGRLAAVFHLCQ
jgi:hypothetical protein